jgi:S1-C subfamily serine protease
VILQVDGKTFNSIKDLHNYIASKKPGDSIRLNVWSQGVKKFVAIKLGETPAEQPVSQDQEQQQPEDPEQQP